MTDDDGHTRAHFPARAEYRPADDVHRPADDVPLVITLDVPADVREANRGYPLPAAQAR
jgi:hypothetical protein